MASPPNARRNYHVFLSFRGADVRNNFISHLYTALDHKGIQTYIDSEELRKGEQISPTLMKAIEDSRIAVVVFSSDYASSVWCLEEVAKIMECKEQKGLIVLPVFYRVEPGQVRGQRENYGRALAKHELECGKDSGKVKRWKKALSDAGSLAGWHLNDGYEAEIIQSIVKEISTQLDRTPLHVAKHLVGIDSQMERLKSMLNLESDDVLIIGLWGQGGIGKTTLTKAIYNSIFRQFEGSSFLARIRENSHTSNDLVHMQEKLLSEIFPRKHLTVFSVDGGINLIQDRLCCKKVLIVLDDVDRLEQLNAFAGASDWFGKGSRIIITTRDKQLLTSHGIELDRVYEVKSLIYHEALKLFSFYAFPGNQKVEIRWDLVVSTLRYANGLPLALELLGSFLRGRRECDWESTLHRLTKSPHKIINDILKVSYDGLDDCEKEIFLDIACFFKGSNTEYTKKVLDSFDFDATIGIQILIERSLISDVGGYLDMHQTIRAMGKDIVNKECRDDPGRRSRLWLYDDILDVLSRDTGVDAVKAIVLQLSKPEEIYINPNVFANMRRLRLLIMRNVHFSFEGPIYFPSNLSWFEWPECSASTLEFMPGQKKLVGLYVLDGKIGQHLLQQFENFKKLKFVDFSQCETLVHIPDLSCTPNLVELNLSGCKNLVEVPQSVGYLDKLEKLNLTGCSKLEHFPGVLKTKSLRTLYLSSCPKLEKFPEILDKLEFLEELKFCGTAVRDLPASIGNLVSLKQMYIGNCKNLTTLPSSIYKLQKLRYLYLEGCSNFVEFPKKTADSTDPRTNVGLPSLSQLDLRRCNLSDVGFLGNLSSFPILKELQLSGNNFTSLPTCISKRRYLEHLQVKNCEQLQELPELPPNTRVLLAGNCKSLRKIPDLSSLSSKFLQLELSSCHELVRKGLSMADVLSLEEIRGMRNVEILLAGSEMPEWLLHGKDGFISFNIPRELYEEFLGLALCVVFELEDGIEVDHSCEVQIIVNGTQVSWHTRFFFSLESDHVWLEYYPRHKLWKIDELLQNDWSHVQVCFRPWKRTPTDCGFRLMCKKKEDDLGVKLEPVDVTQFRQFEDRKKGWMEMRKFIKGEEDSKSNRSRGRRRIELIEGWYMSQEK